MKITKEVLGRIRESLLNLEEFFFLYSAHINEDWGITLKPEEYRKLEELGLITPRDITPKGHAEVLDIVEGSTKCCGSFEEFWLSYPDRSGSRLLKKESEKESIKRLYSSRAEEDTEERILEGLDGYVQYLRAERDALKYAYGVISFLEKRAYLNYENKQKMPSVKLA